MRSHLKVYFSFEEDAQALNDSEKGRLLLAMVRYAKDGSIGDLTGNERFLVPVFKAQIDRDIETYDTRITNGNRGGRPRNKPEEEEPEETENNRKKPKETEENLTEPKETEIAKIEDRRQKIKDKRPKIEDRESKRFAPPTVDEVKAYCEERKNGVDPERFVAFYASKGWKVGNQPMKDWKACVITWEKRDNATGKTPSKTVVAQEYGQRDYSGVDAEIQERQNRKMEEFLRQRELERGAG